MKPAVCSPEFSVEQRIVLEVLRAVGTPNPEPIVRADRVTAALLGSYLAPALQQIALALQQIALTAAKRAA